MSKTMEELVIVGVIAIFVLKFMTTSAQIATQQATANSTLGQVSGYASVGEGVLNTFVNDFS